MRRAAGKQIRTGDDLRRVDFFLQIAAERFFRIADVVLGSGIAVDPIGNAHVALENEAKR